MKQLHFYKFATAGLLLLNISILAFFVFTKPGPPPNKRALDFSKSAVEILKLDDQQQKTFSGLARQHNQQMETVNKLQKDLVKPYFNSLTGDDNILNRDTLLLHIQKLERRKLETTYEHFQEVKSILNEDQQAGFDEFINSALEIILLESKPNPPPPKNK